MVNSNTRMIIAILVLGSAVGGCKLSKNTNSRPSNNANTTASSAKPDADGVIHSATGVEREKPAAGKAIVQGKVLYNEKPAADIEVKLCATFSRFVGGCGGDTFTARTDANGE